MKLTLHTPKPRNPFVAAAARRPAGSHRPGRKADRQHGRHDVRRQLAAAGIGRHDP